MTECTVLFIIFWHKSFIMFLFLNFCALNLGADLAPLIFNLWCRGVNVTAPFNVALMFVVLVFQQQTDQPHQIITKVEHQLNTQVYIYAYSMVKPSLTKSLTLNIKYSRGCSPMTSRKTPPTWLFICWWPGDEAWYLVPLKMIRASCKVQ